MDLPGNRFSQTTVFEKLQGFPREPTSSPSFRFSITTLEWVFSIQATRDGF
jgi:hypothetical protein